MFRSKWDVTWLQVSGLIMCLVWRFCIVCVPMQVHAFPKGDTQVHG